MSSWAWGADTHARRFAAELDTLGHGGAPAACTVMEPSGLRIGAEMFAKRRKQEGEHASVRTCTLQLVLDPWTLPLLMAVTTHTVEMFKGGTLQRQGVFRTTTEIV